MDSTLSQLLERLSRLGVQLRVEGERLVCNAPNDVLTADLQAEIGRRKPQLLALLGASAHQTLKGLQLKRRPPDGSLATVSFGQERLWLLQQMNPESFGYNIPSAVRLHGPLHIAALESALSEIVRRHEILRTTVSLREGRLVQVVHAPSRVSLPCHSLSTRGPDLVDREVSDEVTRLAQQPFDLSEFPYWRFLLLRLGPEDHVLVTIQHHIVSDGWSIGVLMHELSSLYQANLDGKESPLPELPIQYGDYAHWQRERLSGENLDALLSWWKKYLADVPRTLDLPTDFPRPDLQSDRGDWEVLTLGDSYCRKLREFCGRHAVTPFMMLLSVFSVFLARYSGQRDLAIGTPSGNRDHPHCEGLLGFFLNTLAVRLNLNRDPSFTELVQQSRSTTLDVFSHQELPFEKLVDALQLERDLSRSPVFQAMFIMHSQRASRLHLHNLTLGEVAFESGTAKYDLTLAATLFDDHIILTLEYRTSLFESTTVRRMLRQIKELLTSALELPELPVSQLRFVPQDELSLVVTRWNQTSEEYPKECTIDALVLAQAQNTPHQIAVRDLNTQLTYQDLSVRVRNLSQRLADRGLVRNQRVAVYLDRSAEMIVGLLAILHVGAAYVPLDDALPRERLQFIMKDAAIAGILTQESKRPDLDWLGVPLVTIDSDLERIDMPSGLQSGSSASSNDYAYVIYTSGSTGQPKGVAITHQSVVNLMVSMARRVGITAEDRMIALTSLGFDIAVLELLLPLTIGARIVIASAETSKDGRAISKVLQEEDITIMQATPTSWMLLLQTGWGGSHQLTALSGGEPLSRTLARDLLRLTRTVWNLYGPTETTVWSSAQRVHSADTTPAIGRPIANTQLYCLDEHLEPVPIGATGELYIAGDGLAAGYVNRPGQTAASFIPNSFSSLPGARMYRTGDLVRYLGSGQLQFLRRVDRQVKVRGHRIELEEIEQALLNDPSIACAIVDVDRSGAGDAIVAWVIPRDHVNPGVESVRDRLSDRLPSYMVPNRLVLVESLPTTANGKLDRSRLPNSYQRTSMERNYEAPQRPLEERIAVIWKRALRIDRVGLYDNFFDLGGHSLLLATVREELDREFDRQLSMVDLFRHPSIWSLSRYLEKSREM